MITALSVAIITFNEEQRLGDCLKSLSFADEIIVVDSYSTDKSRSIAKSFGAKVTKQHWQGFGRQKQMAIDLCSNRWVLIVDADERIPPETVNEIGHQLSRSHECAAFQLPRKNYFLQRWIKHAGWWPDYVVRLFDKNCCKMDDCLVHESIVVTGKLGTLSTPIIHHATKNLAHTMEKMNRYSSAGAREMYQKGQRASYGKAFSRGAWAFFYNYFVRKGFLDGGPGFLIAISDAVNKFFKYAKLVELTHKHKGYNNLKKSNID